MYLLLRQLLLFRRCSGCSFLFSWKVSPRALPSFLMLSGMHRYHFLVFFFHVLFWVFFLQSTQHILILQYLKENVPPLKAVAALSGFPFGVQSLVHYHLLFFRKSSSSAQYLCAGEQEKERRSECSRMRAGSNGTFDFLLTLGAIETRGGARSCDTESVLITKTGIKLSSKPFQGLLLENVAAGNWMFRLRCSVMLDRVSWSGGFCFS